MIKRLFILLCLACTAAVYAQDVTTHERILKDEEMNDSRPDQISMAPDEYADTIRTLIRHERWTYAKFYLDAAEREWGVHNLTFTLFGRYWMHIGDYDKARRYLISALHDDEANTETMELLVKVEEHEKNYATAIVHVNELLRYNPYSPRLWRKKIELYRLIGNDKEANRLLYRLAEIYPEDEQIQKDVQYLKEQEVAQQRKSGNEREVQEALTELLEANPTDANYYLELSSSLLKEGKLQQAEEVCAKGVFYTKGNRELIRRRVSILSDEARFQEAEFYLDDCIRLYGKSGLVALRQNLRQNAAEAADQDEAYTRYQRLYGVYKSDDALDWLVRHSMQRGYWDDAQFYVAEDIAAHGVSSERLAKAHLVEQRLGNQRAADRLLEQRFEYDPQDVDVREQIALKRLTAGQALMQEEMWRDALVPLRQADTLATDSDMLSVIERRIATCQRMLPDTTQRDSLADEDWLMRSVRYEKEHNYDSAYACIQRYRPTLNEYVYWKRHSYLLETRTMHNNLAFDYQYARRSSIDEWSHNASVIYTHSWKNDALDVGAAYAGRESAQWTEQTADGNDTTIISGGGTGVQLTAGYMHYFKWGDLDIHATWASLFFPIASVKLTMTENLPKEWTLTERLAWRYINDETIGRYHLIALGLTTTKQINGFYLAPTIDLFYMNRHVYLNGGAKMQYFPLDGDRSHVFTSVGVGNAPELTLLDNNLPLRFAYLNTNVSVGGYYTINGHLGVSASASWYVLSNNDTSIRNYLYLNVGMNVSF